MLESDIVLNKCGLLDSFLASIQAHQRNDTITGKNFPNNGGSITSSGAKPPAAFAKENRLIHGTNFTCWSVKRNENVLSWSSLLKCEKSSTAAFSENQVLQVISGDMFFLYCYISLICSVTAAYKSTVQWLLSLFIANPTKIHNNE